MYSKPLPHFPTKVPRIPVSSRQKDLDVLRFLHPNQIPQLRYQLLGTRLEPLRFLRETWMSSGRSPWPDNSCDGHDQWRAEGTSRIGSLASSSAYMVPVLGLGAGALALRMSPGEDGVDIRYSPGISSSTTRRSTPSSQPAGCVRSRARSTSSAYSSWRTSHPMAEACARLSRWLTSSVGAVTAVLRPSESKILHTFRLLR